MQIRLISIPFISRSKMGGYYGRNLIFPNAKDQYIFIKFGITWGYYRLFVYEVPYGNPETAELEIGINPLAISSIVKQSGIENDVLKLKDRNRVVYRISNTRIYLYQTKAFFFDPLIPADQFQILNIQFVKPSELANMRLEFTGIFDTGNHLDSNPRFRPDSYTRVA